MKKGFASDWHLIVNWDQGLALDILTLEKKKALFKFKLLMERFKVNPRHQNYGINAKC